MQAIRAWRDSEQALNFEYDLKPSGLSFHRQAGRFFYLLSFSKLLYPFGNGINSRLILNSSPHFG